MRYLKGNMDFVAEHLKKIKASGVETADQGKC